MSNTEANTAVKAVIFDMGGVVLPKPKNAAKDFIVKYKVPMEFIEELTSAGTSDNNAFCKLERGELTLSEFVPRFDLEAMAKAAASGVSIPDNFAEELLKGLNQCNHSSDSNKCRVEDRMLSASTILRQNGIQTCILTNNWIDDQNNKEPNAKFMNKLKLYFNGVIESSCVGYRKPERRIYEYACKRLGVQPKECAFLDDSNVNIAAATELGINGIVVDDPDKALQDLGALTGIDLSDCEHLYPAPCTPSTVVHGSVEVKPGITIHFVESGEGPAIILLHGFPDLWYGWRYQIPALANAGYRAIALDQRGYGKSSSPDAIDEYSHEELSTDVISFMDKLGIGVATVVGHGLGGSLAWTLALKFPNRFRGICQVNTPYYNINPAQNPLVKMSENAYQFPNRFRGISHVHTPFYNINQALNPHPLVKMNENAEVFYFEYFLKSEAETELRKDVERTLSIFFHGHGLIPQSPDDTNQVGILVGFPEPMPVSSFIFSSDMEVYVEAFKKSGFRGPLNWYRNYKKNSEWLESVAQRKIPMDVLIVTTDVDEISKPGYLDQMKNHVLDQDRHLTTFHIDNCGQWTMQEQAFHLTEKLIEWLTSVHGDKSSY